MKKIIITSAAIILACSGLAAQNNNSDSLRIHVVKNVNGTVQEIDTTVAPGQQQNLFQWMAAQGIEIEEIPANGNTPRIINVQVEQIMIDSGNANPERIAPPQPPLPPDAPKMKLVTITHEGPPAEGMETEVIVDGDTTRTITRHKEVIILNDCKKTVPPMPPVPPAPPAPPANGKMVNPSGENAMNVYPNPSNGKITLEFQLPGIGKTNITITDMNGKLVYSEQLGEAFAGLYRKEINIGTAKGNYTVQVQKEGIILRRQVLVQ